MVHEECSAQSGKARGQVSKELSLVDADLSPQVISQKTN
jgi:hypothetical protein